MNTTTIQHEFTQKVRRGIFNPVRRYLSATAADADRFEEGVASAWRLYSQKAAAGQIVPDAILVHHCRLRATDLRRDLVGNGGRRREDALESSNYHRGKVEVCPFDETGLAHVGRQNPEEVVNSAIDLESWIAELPEKDQAIISGRAAGDTLKEIATKVGMSFSGVRGRLQRLGNELALRMGVAVPA